MPWLIVAGLIWACAETRDAGTASSSQGSAPRAGTPRLVVMVIVDQLGRAEFERLAGSFAGGFKVLLDRGVYFSATEHAHATTETAPGHATLASGASPRAHGIVANWWVEEPGLPGIRWAIDDEEFDESPRQLQVSTLGDWMKERFPAAKTFGVSGKDRAAILLAGHSANGAFWFDGETGGFTSSAYYPGSPSLIRFNERRAAERFYGSAWEPLPLEAAVAESLGVRPLELGPLHPRFPHVPGRPQSAPVEDFFADLRYTPWLDELVAELGGFLITAEQLGQDEIPDLLALSFSAPDFVGHRFGPNSREYVDVLLRLDRTIGQLLDLIDERIGLQHTVVALSSDHGVVPVPEVRQALAQPGSRMSGDTVLCLQRVGSELAREHGIDRWLISGPFLAPESLQQTGLSRRELEAITAQRMDQCPGVTRVWTRGELMDAESGSIEEQLFAASFHPARSADFVIQFEEFLMTSRTAATTHGTVYAYDRQVPLLLTVPDVVPRNIARPTRSLDLAPTLAALIGVAVPPSVEGMDLSRLFLDAPEGDRTGN